MFNIRYKKCVTNNNVHKNYYIRKLLYKKLIR